MVEGLIYKLGLVVLEQFPDFPDPFNIVSANR